MSWLRPAKPPEVSQSCPHLLHHCIPHSQRRDLLCCRRWFCGQSWGRPPESRNIGCLCSQTPGQPPRTLRLWTFVLLNSELTSRTILLKTLCHSKLCCFDTFCSCFGLGLLVGLLFLWVFMGGGGLPGFRQSQARSVLLMMMMKDKQLMDGH